MNDTSALLRAYARLLPTCEGQRTKSKRSSFVSSVVHAVRPQELEEQEGILGNLVSLPVRETLEKAGKNRVALEEEEVGKVAD